MHLACRLADRLGGLEMVGRRGFGRALATAVATILPSATTIAQPCSGSWLPGWGVNGFGGGVNAAAMWDPDGAGPQPPRLVVGGIFALAGRTPVNSLAFLDPVTGQTEAFPAQINDGGWIRALAAMPNGELVAAGRFNFAGGTPAANIARWNGVAWEPLGQGVGPVGFTIAALAVMPNGDLIAGGEFSTAGGAPASAIARWDGTAWSPLGSGLANNSGGPRVNALSVRPNGDLIVGGEFTSAGGVSARNVARWNGTAWSAMGAGLGRACNALVALPDGQVIAGGSFRELASTGMIEYLARWDGASWRPVGSSTNDIVTSLTLLSDGDLIVGGRFSRAGGVAAEGIARLREGTWSPLGTGVSRLSGVPISGVLELPDASLFVFGDFLRAGQAAVVSAARWNGSVWTAVVPTENGPQGAPRALLTLPDGRLLVAGGFDAIGPDFVGGVGLFDGARWSPFGQGLSSSINAAISLPDGDIAVTGSFLTVGAVTFNGVARWNGSGWSPLGSGLNGSPSRFGAALAFMPGRGLVVAGGFTSAGGTPANNIALWNGTDWSALGQGLNGAASDLLVMPDGSLVVSGSFTTAGGVSARNIARWDGALWSPLGQGLNGRVADVALMPSGEIVAGGSFTASGDQSIPFLARWDGNAWHPVGGGTDRQVYSLAVSETGNLIVGGNFSFVGGVAAEGIALWNGQRWSALGSGLGPPSMDGASEISVLPNGEIAVSGAFALADGKVSSRFARYSFTGTPTIAQSPQPVTISAGQTIILDATPSAGYSNVSVHWRRNGQPIADGPEGASFGGGIVFGASAILESPTIGSPATLTISGAQATDVGLYTAVFSNTCGSRETVAAIVRCRADLDGSMFVDVDDFVTFIAAFERGCLGPAVPDSACTVSADIDQSGVVDSDDFGSFVFAFSAGC